MTIVLVSFLLLLVLAVPIGYIMGISSLLGLISMGGAEFLRILITRLQAGLNDFVLVAILFFVLASEFMNRSGITDRLIGFANKVIGHRSGGLSHVNIIVSIIFAGLTGTAVTDTVAIGNVLIPAMKKEGYGADFSAAVTATSSVLGPIIPPSIVMVIYSSLIRETTARSLFAAGIVPGLIVAGALLVISAVQSYRRHYPRQERAGFKEVLRSGRKAFLPLLTPLIILGPILLGITTVTEAAAMGTLYALILGLLVYRTLSLRSIWSSLLSTAKICGVVFLLICAAHTLGWFVTRSGISTLVAELLVSLFGSPFLILAMFNVVLLLAGMFIDVIPAAIILAPILAPALTEIGFNPLHIAIVMIVNLNIGNATPPMGMTLMTASRIARVPYEKAIKEALPFLAAEIAVAFLITYVPAIPLWLPQLLGFV